MAVEIVSGYRGLFIVTLSSQKYGRVATREGYGHENAARRLLNEFVMIGARCLSDIAPRAIYSLINAKAREGEECNVSKYFLHVVTFLFCVIVVKGFE